MPASAALGLRTRDRETDFTLLETNFFDCVRAQQAEVEMRNKESCPGRKSSRIATMDRKAKRRTSNPSNTLRQVSDQSYFFTILSDFELETETEIHNDLKKIAGSFGCRSRWKNFEDNIQQRTGLNYDIKIIYNI